MPKHKFDRFWRHFSTDHRSARRAFPPHTLTRIGSAIATGEQTHSGQVRFVVEAALPLSLVLRDQKSRGHALDKAVEIVADRGIHRRVGDAAWESICRTMEAAFREGRFEDGAVTGINAINAMLAEHFPRSGSGPNELSDQPEII
jgi:uncharacterized membrane protein